MDINVSVNKICIANPDILNSGEAYIHKLKFNFSEEYTPDLVYRACFTCLSGTFVSPILNNECEIPPEALEADGTIELGVYAYILQDETLEKRFSPEHLFLTINAGSYREGLESEAPTPTEQEQWLNAFNQNYLEKMQSANEEIEQAKDEAIEEIEGVAGGLAGRVSVLETDVTGIKTEQIVQNGNIRNNTTAINGINQSLRNYALKSEIPTDLNQLSNATTRFVNETQLSTAVSAETTARQNADTNLQNQINSLASGSPKGTYIDAAALKAANPDTGVYVATSNGHIYSWTKNQSDDPVDLGVYQATSFPEVEDIRIGYDETQYSSAGNAVRTQIKNLEDDIDPLKTEINVLSNKRDWGQMTPPLSYTWAPLIALKDFKVSEIEISIKSSIETTAIFAIKEKGQSTSLYRKEDVDLIAGINDVIIRPNVTFVEGKEYIIAFVASTECLGFNADNVSVTNDYVTNIGTAYLYNNANIKLCANIKSKIMDISKIDVSKMDISKLNDLVANNFKIENKELKNISNASVPSYVGTKVNDIITQIHSGSGNNWWSIWVSPSAVTSNFLKTKFTIDNIVGKITLYLQYTDLNGSTQFNAVQNYEEAGTHEYTFDLNYYVVYKNIDLTKSIGVLFANYTRELNATYSFASLYDLTSQIEGKMETIINDFDTRINTALNESETSTTNIKMVGSNGEKYFLQVSNGNVTASPVLPSNILYIGNSLLLGFSTFGMAASNSNEDYYHYVNEYLTDKGKTVNATKMSGTTFEASNYEGQNTWMNNTLLPRLNDGLDLVIVQLGDNVSGSLEAFFEQGAKNLISFIRTHAPNARVAWVGEWYSNAFKQRCIANACVEYGGVFVDISGLPGVSGNRNHIGAVITRDDGSTFTIDNEGVASHPSSQGMRAVANKIISTLFE